MLRLFEDEERAVREFRNMYNNEKKKKNESSFVGRVFRSPTLFEDMVKCMLLCNCQSVSLSFYYFHFAINTHTHTCFHFPFLPTV